MAVNPPCGTISYDQCVVRSINTGECGCVVVGPYEVCVWCCCSHHIAGTGEVIIEQAFQGHPADRSVLVIPQTMVVHRKQVSSKGIVCDLYLHVIVNAVRTGERERERDLSLVCHFQTRQDNWEFKSGKLVDAVLWSRTLTHSSWQPDLCV